MAMAALRADDAADLRDERKPLLKHGHGSQGRK